MIYVEKSICPKEIQEDLDAQKAKPEWDTIPEVPDSEQAKRLREEFFDKLNKDRLREVLVKEQHGLCVYCMSRIESVANSDDGAVIEHWYPLSKSKEKALQYGNLFASCYGGQKSPVQGRRRICCCDAKKQDSIIQVNPCDPYMMEHIMYYSDGRIDFMENYASPKDRKKFQDDLWHHLGLNGSIRNDGTLLADTATELVKKRKDAYQAAEAMLATLEMDGELTSERVEEIIAEMQSKEIWDEYIGVTIFVLRQGV